MGHLAERRANDSPPAPLQVVADRFVGVVDSITGRGQDFIIAAIFSAQQVAQAIRRGDLPARGLSEYDRLFHGPFLRGLDIPYWRTLKADGSI